MYNLLFETYLLLDDGDRRFFARYAITASRYHALAHIHHTPGLSLSELSEKLLCTKGNTTRILQGLEAQGYLRRESNQADNRALRLYLTPAGEQRLQEIGGAYQVYNELRFNGLSLGDQGTLSGLLGRLNDHLRLELYPLSA